MKVFNILTGWTLLVVIFLPHSNEACDRAFIEGNCNYKCNCVADSCDKYGSCTSNYQCKQHWFGQYCQYRNLVKDFGSSATRDVIDGDSSTCQRDQNSKRVSITFSSRFYFTWMKLVFRKIGNFTINFNNGGMLCMYMRVYAESSNTIDVACQLPTEVEELSINGNLAGNLCDVFVNGGRNVALKQRTSQTSTQSKYDVLQTSDHAVDGNTDPVQSHGSCMMTDYGQDVHEFWEIFYRHPVFLYRVLVYNFDEYRIYLSGFKLETYSTNNEFVESYKEPGRELIMYTVVLKKTTVPITRMVIKAQSFNTHLQMCEVESFGDFQCHEGVWGLDCHINCYCSERQFCSPFSGKCSDKCPVGFYGPYCEKNCTGFCDNQGCHYKTGACFKCAPGYIGDCTKVCPKGKFGNNCVSTCSNKCPKGECFPNNGFCTGCVNLTYGNDCSKNCSNACFKRQCDTKTGNCFSCKAGFYGNNCTMKCRGNCVDKICHFQNGSCLTCLDGFFETTCLNACKKACEDGACNRTTGYCGPGCPVGLYGPKCLENCTTNCDLCDADTCFKCSKGMYREDCSGQCPKFCESKTCNMSDGTCESCAKGFYGEACNQTCNENCVGSVCDFLTGSCDLIQEIPVLVSKTMIILLILALLIIAALLFLLHRRRGGTLGSGEEE